VDVYQEHVTTATALVESEEPKMIAFNNYASDDGTDVTCVQVHSDAQSLDPHLRLFTEKLASRVYEALDSTAVSIYGQPSEAALDMLRHSGVPVQVLPLHQGGFPAPPAGLMAGGAPPTRRR
jgi:hypothetical protein